MPTTFLNLPSEIRNDIYERLLVLDEPITPMAGPWHLPPQPPALTPELLLSNKTVHHEASSLLYAQNRFDFAGCHPEQINSFFEQIGLQNASNIRHIIIDFPEFYTLDPQDVRLEDDGVTTLTKIKTECMGLKTITTSLYSTHMAEVRLSRLDSPNVVAEAVAVVNARFKAIPSLQQIIVEVSENSPCTYMRKEMENVGWTTMALKYEEPDLDRSWSDGDDEDNDLYYNDADGDDYDIDNDSDFWRRAGD